MATRGQPVSRQQIFEARYEGGYRYLDRCGDAMLILEKALAEDTDRLWLPQEMAPAGARLICPELDFTIVFHAERLIVDRNPIGELPCDFAQVASTALATIKGRFDLRRWRRFGSRRVNVLGTDSIDDAERLTLKHSPFGDWRDTEAKSSGLEQRDVGLTLTFELPDRSKGVRFRTVAYHQVWAPLQLDERLRTPPHMLPTGQREALLEQYRRAKRREQDPEAGLMIDIDYYWIWPPEDAVVKDFLQEAKEEADRLEDSFIKTRG